MCENQNYRNRYGFWLWFAMVWNCYGFPTYTPSNMNLARRKIQTNHHFWAIQNKIFLLLKFPRIRCLQNLQREPHFRCLNHQESDISKCWNQGWEFFLVWVFRFSDFSVLLRRFPEVFRRENKSIKTFFLLFQNCFYI